MGLEHVPTKDLEDRRRAAYRLLQAPKARDKMLDFAKFIRADPQHPDDPAYSAFEETPLARLLCDIIEKVDRGKLNRVAVSVGPQLGKSEVLSRMAPAWLSGRNPRRHMILGSYNDKFAQEFGGEVRDIMQCDAFNNVFPSHSLKSGSEARDLLQTTDAGKMAFVGVGGSGTGKPADFFFVDDPIKSDEDAQSQIYRDKMWKWFNATVFSRCHNRSAIIVVHTRWHEDDLIGRLCDPDHPERNKTYAGIADRWTYYNLPAIVQDASLAAALGLTMEPPKSDFVRKMFGIKPMVSLWEGRKSLEFLAEAKQQDPRVFGALYMGKPAPDEGSYFREEDLVEYDAADLPVELVKYGASDHAVSETQKADSSVLGCVGVDEKGDIWVLPDLVWEKMETDDTVDEMIVQMKTHKPQLWWIENELISKSFGPFLKIRMHEQKVYTTLDPQTPTKKKRVRARAIQGRMRMKKVHFPRFAPWWPEAKKQLLMFDYGAHDDFVDWLAWIGLGLTKEYGAPKTVKEDEGPKPNTMAWILASSKAKEKAEKAREAHAGW